VQPEQSSVKNLLLANLSASDFALLCPHLSHIALPRSEVLSHPGKVLEHCWFLESGIASMVASTRDGHETEAGIIGLDGIADVASILGVQDSPLRCFMQIAGDGYAIPVSNLTAAYDASPSLRASLNRFAFTILCQIAQTALANASLTIEERLARWLLMCADRIPDGDLALTHEFLAIMLNVRRAGVTLAVQSLQSAGFLDPRRGAIRIADRPGLEEFANDFYSPLA
jgi:CRP-like cAMP-binding protein